MIIPCSIGHWRFWSGDQLALVVVQPDRVIGVDITCTRPVRLLRIPGMVHNDHIVLSFSMCLLILHTDL